MPQRDGALAVLKVLREAGHSAYFAGGCVRDLLLGRTPKDWDVATSATPEQVTQLFRRTLAIGAAFGVIKVLWRPGQEYEVATYRTEGDYSDGRRPDQVHPFSQRNGSLHLWHQGQIGAPPLHLPSFQQQEVELL